MGRIEQLRRAFRPFAVASVFLSRQNGGRAIELGPIAESVHTSSGYLLLADDLAAMRGLLGSEVLSLEWDCDERPGLYYTLYAEAAVGSGGRRAKRRRTNAATGPVQLAAALVAAFDRALDELGSDGEAALEQLARENMPSRAMAPAPVTADRFLDHLRAQPFYRDQIVATEQVTAAGPKYQALTAPVDKAVMDALSVRSPISQLYTHQAEAIDLVLEGHDVVVSTATASGKSVIYQVPILQMLLHDPQSRFILVFPTKALAQDQCAALSELVRNIPQLQSIEVLTLDGDTGAKERRRIREAASVILTNPDTLHTSILPNADNWQPFLRRLKLVVLDELHVYQGQFGQHVQCILARLQRWAPTQFVACSATTSNPCEHLEQLTGRVNVRSVHVDGAPRGPRELVLWHAGAQDVVLVATQLLSCELRTIVFCQSRQMCELILRGLADHLATLALLRGLADQVTSYRGGYTQEKRRAIERELFSGRLRMVVATSALELGIDVGSLDCVLVVGAPVSAASLWQQIGRAGRSCRPSLALVLARSAPLDRQAIAHPQAVFAREFAPATLAAEPSIFAAHLQCAAFERPIDVDSAEDRGLVEAVGAPGPAGLPWDQATSRWCCGLVWKPWPALKVPIRGSAQQQTWEVVSLPTPASHSFSLLEELDRYHALFALYSGGVFLHQGRTFTIEDIDADSCTVLVAAADISWFTIPRDYQQVTPQSVVRSGGMVHSGPVQVCVTVFGYRRVDIRTRKVLELVENSSPPLQYLSTGLWINLPARVAQQVAEAGFNVEASIHAAQHAWLAVVAKQVGCLAAELCTECKSPLAKRPRPPRLVIYERAGGATGDGPTARALAYAPAIVNSTLARVSQCPCDSGCSACIFLAQCTERNDCLNKAGAELILELLLD